MLAILALLGLVTLVAVFDSLHLAAARGAAMSLLSRSRGAGQALGWVRALQLAGVGVGAGTLAGLLGMGGGVLKVAGMLVFFSTDIFLARAVSLTTMFLATLTASRVHVRAGNVSWKAIRIMAFPAVVGVLLGIVTGLAVSRVTLTHFFAFFALLLGFNTLAQTFADPHEHVVAEGRPRYSLRGRAGMAFASVGALHGLVCGLLGISGGVVAMPMQQFIARVPAREAVANAVVLSAMCTSVGSVVAVIAGVSRNDFTLSEVAVATICIGVGAVVGANIGARLTGTVPVFVLRLLFVQVSIAAGLMILFR